MDSAIARIEAHNPKINALIIFGYDDARKAAKAAEAAIMRGDKVGPLHGLPFAMKDCFDFKRGWVTTFGGIRALKDYVVDTYCMFVERMEQAGAITVGKTNSPAFGFRGTCDNYMYGPSKNPFDLAKNTGGSSGGSAGAVAAGLLPICEGTDGGGSIRIPASWCGVFGYKPSFGRVPFAAPAERLRRHRAVPLRGPDHAARWRTPPWRCRSWPVTICAIPTASRARSTSWRALRASIAGKTIAYTRDYGIFPVDPRVIAVVDKAVKAFEEAGAHVEEVKIDIRRTQRELSDVWCRFIAVKQVAALDGFKRQGIDLQRDHRDDLPPEVWHWDEIGRRPDGTQSSADQACARRSSMRSATCSTATTSCLADAGLPRRRQRAPTATRSGRPRSTASRSTG